MANNNLNDLIGKLEHIKNHLAEEIAPEIEKLFKKSVKYSIVNFYNDYSPTLYERKYDLYNIEKSANVRGKRRTLTLSADSGYMQKHASCINDNYLQPSTLFEYAFMGGEHGHTPFMMRKSKTPYSEVNADILSAFKGKAYKTIDNSIKKILK